MSRGVPQSLESDEAAEEPAPKESDAEVLHRQARVTLEQPRFDGSVAATQEKKLRLADSFIVF